MKTKTLLLSIVLLLASTFSAMAYTGAGTAVSPYILLTPTDLTSIATAVNAAGGTGAGAAYYELGGNINMSGTAWQTAIGSSSPNFFSGNFDGKGYSITGLFLGTSGTPSTANGNLALFSALKNATIRNLKVNVSFYLTKSGANSFGCGGIFNTADGGTSYIDNCEVSGTIQFTVNGTITGSTLLRVGGIGAAVNTTGTTVVVTNCFVNTALTADNSATNSAYSYTVCAGIIADCAVTGTIVKIANSYAAGSVYARINYANSPIAGGILGNRPAGTGITWVYNCYASNTVKAYNSSTGSSAWACGIVGALLTNDADQKIMNNIALNPSLTWVVGNTGTPSMNMNRIAYKQANNTFSANSARDNMTFTSLKSSTDGVTGTVYGTKTATSSATGADGLNQANATMAADALTSLNAYVSVPANSTFEGVTLKAWSAGLVGDSYFPVLATITPTITFGTPTSVSKTYGDAAYTNAATSNSSGTKTYTSGTTSVATVNSSTGEVTIVSAGSSIITATQAASGNYTAGTQTYTLTVAKASQTISFGTLPTGKTVGEADFAPGATSATSGVNAISYSSSNTAVASIVSGQIHIVGVGTCTIYADQALSTNYNAATQQSQSLTIAARPVLIMGSNATAADLTNDVADISVPASADLTIGATRTIHNITIERGGKVTLNDGFSLTVNDFIINSDASGTGTFVDMNSSNANGLTVNGTSTVNQSLQSASALRTWYITPPVATTTPTPALTTIKYFDETINTGTALDNWKSATSMVAQKGYQVVPVSGNDISFTGTLNTGNQNITLTRRDATFTNFSGFNLIGNPYPSYLDWSAVCAYTDGTTLNSSIMPTTTMWYRTKARGSWEFVTVNGAGVTSPTSIVTKYIPPMQAFWVRAKTAGGGTLKLTNTMRAHTDAVNNPSPNLLKAPATDAAALQLVRLQVSNGTRTDEAVIYFSPTAANGFDMYDAPKMANADPFIPEIYTMLNGEQITINAMSNIPLDTPIGLGFVAGNASSFSIKANEITNLPAGVKLVLKDNVTMAETDLTDAVTSYSFSPVVTSSDRFSVIFRTPGAVTGLKNTQDNSILVYNNTPQELSVICNDMLNVGTMVTVYNAIGQKLLSQQLTGTSMKIAGKFTSGVYVVKVNNTTKKVIIN